MLGSTYSLIAIGYTLVFGSCTSFTSPHGEVFMIGAFIVSRSCCWPAAA
jgi:branched-chain amino acid transport system permease protein